MLKWYIQYFSKSGKFSSDHRTGKRLIFKPIQRRTMPKDVKTTVQLLSFPMLGSLGTKSFKLGFSSTWTGNLQMYKLGLEKEEELEIRLLTSIGLQRKQGNSRKTSTSALLMMWKLLTVCITTNWKVPRDGNTRQSYLSPEKPVCGSKSNSYTLHETMDWFQIGKGVHQGCILSPYLFKLYAEYIIRNTRLHESQAGIKISGRNINSLRYVDDTTLMTESEEELKSLFMRVKEESK